MGEPVLLPSDPAAEQKLIAAVLDESDGHRNLRAVASVRSEWFYHHPHRVVWRAVLALYSRGEAASYETVLNELQATGKLVDVGSENELLLLVNPVHIGPGDYTEAGVRGNARVVAEKHVSRLYVKVAQKLAAAGYDMRLSVWDEIDADKREIDTINALLRVGSFAQSASQVTAQSARDLMAKDIEPTRWAVPNLFAEGLNILAGKPKKGKSTLALQVCLAIAEKHGVVLGKIEVTPGEALYLALEDNERRMQRRLEPMLQHDGDGAPIVPEHLYFRYEWPRLDAGGIDALDSWMKQRPNTRIICIDTFARVKPRTPKNATLYDSDYGSLAPLQQWAIQNHIAVVLIVHLRKSVASADDVIDEISGSTGLTGVADNLIVMRKQDDITSLHRQGRDYVDDTVWALKGNPDTLLWEIEGAIQEVKRSVERVAILDALENTPQWLSPKEVAQITGKTYASVRYLLKQMIDCGDTALLHDRSSQKYRHAKHTNTPYNANSTNTPNSPNTVEAVRGETTTPNTPLTAMKPETVTPEASTVRALGVLGENGHPYYAPGPRASDSCSHCGAHKWGLVDGVDTCMKCFRRWSEAA